VFLTLTSFIIHYVDWQARESFLGHLSEMPVYGASEANTLADTASVDMASGAIAQAQAIVLRTISSRT
jgi:hypothetical protein